MNRDYMDKLLAETKKPTLNDEQKRKSKQVVMQRIATEENNTPGKRWFTRLVVASGAIVAALLFSVMFFIDQDPTTGNLDNLPNVSIDAALTVNTNDDLDYKDYMLEVTVKKGQGNNITYPVMKGLFGMTFTDQEDDGYYIPTSIGTGGIDEQIVVKALKRINILDKNVEKYPYSGFIGFFTPEEAGTYKLRMYFNKSEDFDPTEDMYLVYIHRSSGIFGNNVNTTKVVKVDTSGIAVDTSDIFDQMTGYIGGIISEAGYPPKILVIPNITKEAVIGKTQQEIGEIAQLHDSSWFFIDESEVDKYEIGQKVKVAYDEKQDKLMSDPPQQGSKKVDILKE
ncbi:DUF3221 domain-containing protein [Radiobacillus sp. PE A8.2]|uniref:DUF3221 domain-containing protein n=1 Tax=Radiobacillus sp. PE A8.2 TaxID=3380349 RepID=UPI00388FAEA8